MSASAG